MVSRMKTRAGKEEGGTAGEKERGEQEKGRTGEGEREKKKGG